MKLRRHGTFAGGIGLPRAGPDARDAPIETCGQLSRLAMPCPRPAEPAVTAGQRVAAGDELARGPGGARAGVLAPLAGTVGGFCEASLAAEDGPVSVRAIELTDLSAPEAPASGDETFDWRRADDAALRDRISNGALPTFTGRAEPLDAWLARARRGACEVVAANVMDNEPYLSADHRVLADHGETVIRGLEILRRAVGAAAAAVATDRRRAGSYRRGARAARDLGICHLPLTHKYPVGNDRILTKVLTGREPPADGQTLDVGVAVTDAATCLAVWRWVALGLRATHRTVAIAGHGAQPPRNVWAPFGALCTELAGPAPRLVHGGAMTGQLCLERTVVTPATRALVRMPARQTVRPRACVRCGWCVERCPARLNVPALNDAFELGLGAGAPLAAARACLDCGICSYLCPSRLPLAARIRQLKRPAAPAPGGGPA